MVFEWTARRQQVRPCAAPQFWCVSHEGSEVQTPGPHLCVEVLLSRIEASTRAVLAFGCGRPNEAADP